MQIALCLVIRCRLGDTLLPDDFSGWLPTFDSAFGFWRVILCTLPVMDGDNVVQGSPKSVENELLSEWTPANANGGPASSGPTGATPSDQPSDQQGTPAKRRREDRERTRVSRACDRCKR